MSYYGYNNKSTQMNDWIRMFCKEPQNGLLVTDLDFIFYDFKLKRMKMIEVKTFNAKIKDWQLQLYKKIDFALMNITKLDQVDDFEYEGFYIITLDNDSPETSNFIRINDKQVTKDQLIDFLDFKLRFEELS